MATLTEDCCAQVWDLLHPTRVRRAPRGWWSKPPARPVHYGPVQTPVPVKAPKKVALDNKPAVASAGRTEDRPAKRAKTGPLATKPSVAVAVRPPSAQAAKQASILQVEVALTAIVVHTLTACWAWALTPR